MVHVILKIRHELLGGHVHATFWMGKIDRTLAKNGDLVFTPEEWTAFLSADLWHTLEETDDTMTMTDVPLPAAEPDDARWYVVHGHTVGERHVHTVLAGRVWGHGNHDGIATTEKIEDTAP